MTSPTDIAALRGLLRAMAAGAIFKEHKHDIILNAAADALDEVEVLREALVSFTGAFGDGDAGLEAAMRVGLDAELIEARALLAKVKQP